MIVRIHRGEEVHLFIQRGLIGLLLLVATVVVIPACDESAPTDALSPEQPELYRVSFPPVRDYSFPVVYVDGKRQSIEEAEAFKRGLTPAELERDWDLKS